MSRDRDLKDLKELAAGGRVEVVLPDIERRLRDELGVPVDVTLGTQDSVRIINAAGAVTELLASDRDWLLSLALGLPPTRPWARSVESARRAARVVQSRQRGEVTLIAARLRRAGATHAELQLPARPELLRERGPELASAALADPQERTRVIAPLIEDVLAGWFRGYAPPVTAAGLTAWALENLGLTLTVTVTVGAEPARLIARWAKRDPHLAAVVLGLLRRAEAV